MIKSCSILLTLFSLLQCIVQELKPDTDFGNNAGTRRTLKLSVNSRRNQSGDWVDTFTARTESSISSDRMDLDVTHSFFQCEGKVVMYIQGVSKVNPVGISNGRLSFHQRCGNNIAILNKGRTVQKIRQVAWIYHHKHIYSNNGVVVNNYGKNLNELQDGDRVGVMGSEFGTLHFFVNGVDQGPAASNIPSPAYGLFELRYNAMKATIVDASSAPTS